MATRCPARHGLITASAARVPARHGLASAAALPLGTRHGVDAGPTVDVQVRHALLFGQTTPVAGRHQLNAALSATNPIRLRHAITYSAADGEVRVLFPSPVVRWPGGEASPLTVRLSADQGSAVWLADITLATAQDYAALSVGASIEIGIGDQTWALVVDEKLRERPNGYRIKAVSPLALRGSPWAAPRALGEPGLARATCEALLGQPIDWAIPDWPLPASAAAIEATPLDLARQIVEAVGGLLESLPDGTVRARPASPASPPTERVAGVVTLTDADLYGHGESVGTPRISDRYVVTSGDPASTKPVLIEVLPDPEDPQVRTVLAYAWPWRPMDLVHTGDEAVQVGPRIEYQGAHEETLEVVAGAARTRYPAHALQSSAYRYVDLGAVSNNGDSVETEVGGYSLLDLRYATRAWQWRVEHPRVESIQFLAMEP
jgi:hypothetical protein